MRYIRVEDTLWEHHKFERALRELSPHWKALPVEDRQCLLAGKLLSLWHFTGKHAVETGDLSEWSDESIEHYSRWKGPAGAFVKALRHAGLMQDSCVTNWARRVRQYVALLKNSQRMREAWLAKREGQATNTTTNPTRPSKAEFQQRLPMPNGQNAKMLVAEFALIRKRKFATHEEERQFYKANMAAAVSLDKLTGGDIQLAKQAITEIAIWLDGLVADNQQDPKKGIAEWRHMNAIVKNYPTWKEEYDRDTARGSPSGNPQTAA